MPAVRFAWRGNGPTFHVPDLGDISGDISGGYYREPDIKTIGDIHAHAANLAYLVGRYYDERDRFLRMQSRACASDTLCDCLRDARRYAELFDVDHTAVNAIDINADIAAIDARFARLESRRADPTYDAKRAHAREQRAAAKAAREAESRRLRELTLTDKIAAWRRGECVQFSYSDRPPTMLRVNPSDPSTVETSHGATVPLAHARRLYAAALSARKCCSPWYPPADHAFRVGLYTLNAIDADGTIRIGCHVIPWEESQQFAVSQGWQTDDAPMVAQEVQS
jgi:hypothetical protein